MKAIVSLSGGMDSATVLAKALAGHRECQTVSFLYGSKHNRWENEAADQLSHHYQTPHRLIDLRGLMRDFKSDLLLTGGRIPEGHYEAETMRATVVPGRNTIFTAVLLGLAQSLGASEIWLGVHAGDHFIYPDCRPDWVRDMNRTCWSASEGKVGLVVPFLGVTKVEILQEGLALGVPYRLTRTCYTDGAMACGRCGACQERLAAFRALNQEDPLEYLFRGELSREPSPAV